MKIAVLGTGNVGGILGTRWAQKGHQVVFGSRTPTADRVRKLTRSPGTDLRAGPVAEAVAASDVVILATPWKESRRVLQSAGELAGKILVDCVNPATDDLSALEIGYSTSAAEQIASWVPRARVVKAFNTVSAATMANPIFQDQKATLFYCGDDTPAKRQVHELADQLDFDPVDAGPLSMARYLEPLAMLYIRLAMEGRGSSFAFKLIER